MACVRAGLKEPPSFQGGSIRGVFNALRVLHREKMSQLLLSPLVQDVPRSGVRSGAVTHRPAVAISRLRSFVVQHYGA